MPASAERDLVPRLDDLPGAGWIALDDGLDVEGEDGAAAEALDCVGPEFPDDAVTRSASSPHFLRPPTTLVHGVSVSFASRQATDAAERIFRDREFTACLGRSVAADLDARPADAELLAVDVAGTEVGHRVRFTGGNDRGVRPVHLDIVVVREAWALGLLWFGDTPDPFDPAERDHVIARVSRPGSRRPRP